MKKLVISVCIAAMITVLSVSCTAAKSVKKYSESKNDLSLWTDTARAKKALINYMKTITDPSSPDFIPVENRISIFDLDGTLILETAPTYFDWKMFEHRVLDDPDYKATEEQLAAAHASRDEHKFPGLSASRERMVSEAYAGMTIDEFYAYVRDYMDGEQEGFTGMKRGETFYKPMVQVVEFLISNDFTVYISSGTDRLTVRPLVQANLNIPFSQIIGSDSTIIANTQGDLDGLSYTLNGDEEIILGGVNLIKNLQMNKVTSMIREIGVKPVLAFGNSGTDASMINYSIKGNKYKALGFMLMCDDLDREYGNIEKAEKMRFASEKNGWIPVSMRDDWKTIYGYNVKKN